MQRIVTSLFVVSLAARFGHDEVVTALLISKADTKAKNDEGKTALMLAAEGGHDETVRMLTHTGFPQENSKNQDEQAWPMVLKLLLADTL